jgi:hypothetical protein
MRKILNIGLSIILILCGMHFTIATHYCHGEIAAMKLSFTGRSTSCGTDMDYMKDSPSGTVLTKHCCDNEFAVYKVDSYYSFSENQNKIKPLNNSWFNFIPVRLLIQSVTNFSHHNPNISPPGNYNANAVDITAIRVFRT